MNTEVSKYMREMQRRSAGEKRAKMSALAKARWAKTKRKPKRVARRSNAKLTDGGPP